MAGTSLLTLLDDFAALLDDISVMTKVAAKKTAGVLGDDLALNAKQVQGIAAARELPVIWAVAKGSLKNKAIIVPVAKQRHRECNKHEKAGLKPIAFGSNDTQANHQNFGGQNKVSTDGTFYFIFFIGHHVGCSIQKGLQFLFMRRFGIF